MNQHKILTFTILFILTVVYGCNHKTDKNIEFAFSEDAIVEELNNSPFLGMPLDMKNHENNIYISDFYGDSLLIRYNTESNVFTKFGVKGNGPNEILSPSTLSVKDNKVYVYSKSNFKFGYFDFMNEDSLISSSNYHFLFTPSSSTSDIAVLRNNSFISSGYYKDGRYIVMDNKGDITNVFGEYPEYSEGEKDRPFDVKAMFHQVTFETNHNLQKVVAVSNYVMDIIDYSNPDFTYQRVLLKDYSYDFEKGDLLRTKRSESTVKGAVCVSSSDNYIYVLFNPNTKVNSDLNNEIWIFDWTGKAVKKIFLDIKIDLITVTSDNSIYAISQTEEPSIVEVKEYRK